MTVDDSPFELFVPGRLCLFGEHSDWAGHFRRHAVAAQPLPRRRSRPPSPAASPSLLIPLQAQSRHCAGVHNRGGHGAGPVRAGPLPARARAAPALHQGRRHSDGGRAAAGRRCAGAGGSAGRTVGRMARTRRRGVGKVCQLGTACLPRAPAHPPVPRPSPHAGGAAGRVLVIRSRHSVPPAGGLWGGRPAAGQLPVGAGCAGLWCACAVCCAVCCGGGFYAWQPGPKWHPHPKPLPACPTRPRCPPAPRCPSKRDCPRRPRSACWWRAPSTARTASA